MLKDIVEARPLGQRRLFLRFEDGEEGEVDIAQMIQFTGLLAPSPTPPTSPTSPPTPNPAPSPGPTAPTSPRRALRRHHRRFHRATPCTGRSFVTEELGYYRGN
jgi:hypothetical protein